MTAWALSRLLLVLSVHWSGYPSHRAVTGDVRFYAQWAVGLISGRFPVGDPSWQYPPGAAAVVVAPRELADVVPVGYATAFVALMLVADAVLVALLLWRGRASGTTAGGWVWVAGTTLLGPILLFRFDLVPALFAVAALAVPARPFLAGALLGVGALVKVWPALLLPATRDRGRAVWGAVLPGVVVLAGLLVWGKVAGALDFLGNQQARGLQVETLAATPYLLARSFGVGGIRIVHEYGAYQVLGPGVAAVAAATTGANVAVVVGYLVLAWRRPQRPTLALAALLTVLVTARVLSPQYLIWVLAVAAVAAALEPARARGLGPLLVLAAAATQLLYPLVYDPLLHGAWGGALVLAGRNALLVVAAVRAWAAGLAGPDQGMARPIDTR